MHNVKRKDYEAVPEAEREKKLQKVQHYTKLSKVILKAHAEGVYSEKMFTLVGSLIQLNPDYYTLWNYRRDSCMRLFKEHSEVLKDLCAKEMKLSELALRKNPKSYYAWHHRVWIISKGTTDLKGEIVLCTKYLGMDSRNFHCWNYRRYVMMVGKISLRDELKFSASKIDDNFSNYSAWHHRSFIIPKLLGSAESKDVMPLVKEEFELLKQAFFTDPADQSAWLYHRWLLGLVTGLGAIPSDIEKVLVTDTKQQIKILEREMAMVEELLEAEEECKWGLLAVALLIGGLRERGVQNGENTQRLQNIFSELCTLDPYRKQYYVDMQKKIDAVATN